MRWRLITLLLPILLLAGCATTSSGPTKYYHVSVLNRDGSLVASWTAKTDPQRTGDKLYRFTAVEHTIPNPPRTYHYPLGWRVDVGGPQVVIYRVEEPEWLRGLTPLDVADRAEAGAPEGK